MSRKIIFLSTSFLCFSLLHGPGFAASSPIISNPLPAPIVEEQANIVLAQATTQKTIKKTEKTLKGKTLTPKTPTTSKKLTMPDSSKAGKNLRGKAADLANKGKTVKTTKTTKKTEAKSGAAGTVGTETLTTTTRKRATTKRGTGTRTQTKTTPAPMRETTLQQQNRRAAATFRPAADNTNCICIQGQYCVGPRGGHYCYTSGGNKRYISRN